MGTFARSISELEVPSTGVTHNYQVLCASVCVFVESLFTSGKVHWLASELSLLEITWVNVRFFTPCSELLMFYLCECYCDRQKEEISHVFIIKASLMRVKELKIITRLHQGVCSFSCHIS